MREKKKKKGEALTGGFVVRSTAEKTERTEGRRRRCPCLVSPFCFLPRALVAQLPSTVTFFRPLRGGSLAVWAEINP
jgi:hypothetical protein